MQRPSAAQRRTRSFASNSSIAEASQNIKGDIEDAPQKHSAFIDKEHAGDN